MLPYPIQFHLQLILVVFKCLYLKSRDGEIGRRSGLKIRRSERTVGVRFPLPAPARLRDRFWEKRNKENGTFACEPAEGFRLHIAAAPEGAGDCKRVAREE